ncbi:MFS transporter [Bythopirellula polymerisocia]|uniref:Major Facilitator Superfamily protein n=1 Tax=Bythopirellula polymerisocia TaxID=2528003 RepID=A0A5C6CQV9_9BACT|nr:MFS transporter [Bythopirellula polymerisocia]TWU27303.1 Major Facilitator Superfamily protein [Bythopirellula polymerisocia]
MSQGAVLEIESRPSLLARIGTAFLVIATAHFVIDFLATLVPSSLGLIEVRCGLSHEQAAWLLGLGPFAAGLSQPICALISDRLRTRILIVIGIVVAGIGFGMIGLTTNSVTLSTIYVVGMVGVGMFHPIAATTAAQLHYDRRNSATGVFFVAGMIGGVAGSFVWPRWLSDNGGFDSLPYIVAPILLFALVVHRKLKDITPIKQHTWHTSDLSFLRGNWTNVIVLYAASSMRYCINTALLYLFVRWTEQVVSAEHAQWSAEAVAKYSAPIVGNLNSCMIFGMGLGGLFGGALVSPGKEKGPLIWVPLFFAPLVALFPLLGIQISYLIAVFAGIGFASMIPVSVALAQHLLPHRANLASSLMMGGAWVVATIGPRLAEFGVTHFGIETTFALTAAVLAASGLICCAFREPTAPSVAP